MAVLLAYGAALFPATAVLSVGTLQPHTTLRYTEGVLGLVTRLVESTGAFGLDLGSSRAPDIVGIGNHNITSGSTRVQASDSPDFSSLLVDLPVSVAAPNFWIDLRAVVPRAAQYWRVGITGNAAPVRIGPLVAATVQAIDCYQWEITDITDYQEYLYGTTDFEVLVRAKQQIVIRSREVRWAGPDALAELLQNISDVTGAVPGPVLMIPDERVNDVWFLDWPDEMERPQVIENRQEVKLTLQEQSPGAA